MGSVSLAGLSSAATSASATALLSLAGAGAVSAATAASASGSLTLSGISSTSVTYGPTSGKVPAFVIIHHRLRIRLGGGLYR